MVNKGKKKNSKQLSCCFKYICRTIFKPQDKKVIFNIYSKHDENIFIILSRFILCLKTLIIYFYDFTIAAADSTNCLYMVCWINIIYRIIFKYILPKQIIVCCVPTCVHLYEYMYSIVNHHWIQPTFK